MKRASSTNLYCSGGGGIHDLPQAPRSWGAAAASEVGLGVRLRDVCNGRRGDLGDDGSTVNRQKCLCWVMASTALSDLVSSFRKSRAELSSVVTMVLHSFLLVGS